MACQTFIFRLAYGLLLKFCSIIRSIFQLNLSGDVQSQPWNCIECDVFWMLRMIKFGHGIKYYTFTLHYAGETSADITNCDSDAAQQPMDTATEAPNNGEGKRRNARSQARKTENNLAQQSMWNTYFHRLGGRVWSYILCVSYSDKREKFCSRKQQVTHQWKTTLISTFFLG